MLRYISQRTIHAVITLWLLTLLTFLVVRAMPGDATLALMEQSGVYTEAQLEALRQAWQLDAPMFAQYWTWLKGAFRGDFGYSFYTNQPVLSALIDRFPPTAQLAIMSVVMGGLMGTVLGTIAAIRRSRFPDYFARGLAVLGLSIPEFWLATLVIVLPAFWIGWMPPLLYVPFWESPGSNLQLMIPAAFVSSLSSSAVITRLSRTSMLEVLGSDYVRTAYSKGLSERAVVVGHALRNSLIPALTTIGLQLASLLGGTVVIETIFNIPGIGRQTLFAIQFRDYPQLQMNILFFGTAVVVTNLMIDILYGLIDPRIRRS